MNVEPRLHTVPEPVGQDTLLTDKPAVLLSLGSLSEKRHPVKENAAHVGRPCSPTWRRQVLCSPDAPLRMRSLGPSGLTGVRPRLEGGCVGLN